MDRATQTRVFIFQVNAALNTAASSTVNLINGAQAANVFWQVNGAAGTGAFLIVHRNHHGGRSHHSGCGWIH